ncbi:MAG: hypothetical protein BGO98_05670 [Myxococcales bacterium 68-20]|nr:MAG: hypothetical protein BGO98_05670 [Myxococcales bacterium 68-20]
MTDPSPETTSEDLEIERLARARRQARGLRVAARRAIALARRYRNEEGPRGAREAACVAQALVWRRAAKDLRSRRIEELGPGLARTSGPSREASRRAG